MEGMLILLVMVLITVVLAWSVNGKQRKRIVSLLLCAAMMSSYVPAINVAKADSNAKPVLVNEQVLVNGVKAAQIGAVTYSASGSAYSVDTSSAKVRVKSGDSISFEGVISAPEGETISWVRVDVYDANAEEPYTVGAEFYRASGMKVQEFDLANIPALTIGEAFGSKDYTLAEGGRYIIMFCVGDSNGNTFADMDADIQDDQGPAILVDVKLSPSNCKHPHSDYRYVRHSSGEIRSANYGDALTHQVEPLYERYCGLCDSFLMNIWGQGTSEEHTFGNNGVCLACGYYAAPMMMSNGLQTAAIEGDITITEAKYIDEEGISVFWDCSNNACMYFRIEASIGGDVIFEETRKRNLTGSQNVLIPYDDLILGEECEIYIEGIAENSISAEAITEGDTVYVDIPEGEFLNITDPSDCELEFGAEEESQMIYFEASGRWIAECDDDWVTLSKTSGGSDVVAIEVTVDANDEDVGVERETSIYIALSSGNLEEEIYVYQEGREMTNYEKFQAVVDDLEIDYASGDSEDAVTTDVGLSETGLYGVTISWESSNTAIIDDEGTVMRPDEDTEVELTATLSYYQYTEEKTFYLTVLAEEAVSDEVIQFISHINGDQVNVGDSVTVEWNSTYLYKYYWEIKTLNGEPAYTDEEEGTIIDEGNFQGRGSRTFTVPESASDKWIRVRVYSVNAMDALREYPSNLYLKVNESENVILEAEKTEINAGESVMFTAQSNADSLTLYIEAYNEVAGEWYVAVTKEMTKNGNEFTYTHEFANAGSKRVYAKTANGMSSNTIEITANALKETLEAPVGGTLTATVGEEVTISWGAVANATGYTAHLYKMVDDKLESIGDVTSLINGTSLKYTFTETGEYHVGVTATAEGYNPSEQSAVIVTVEEATETITLSVDKTEINAGETVTFTAQSNADSVTLYIEAYNEVAGEWYVAVTKEMTKNGSEFTYTHEFANAGSKRVYAKTVNGTTSNAIEITANALKETLEAPVGGMMTATVGEEVTISWGAVVNATGYTAHLYEMVDGKLESIGDVTSLISGTSLKYTFTEACEYHVGVIATAEGYNPSEQSAVIIMVSDEPVDTTRPWFENLAIAKDEIVLSDEIVALELSGKVFDDTELAQIEVHTGQYSHSIYYKVNADENTKERDLSSMSFALINWNKLGRFDVKINATDAAGNKAFDNPMLIGYVTFIEEASETIQLTADTTEINAGESVTFTAQSNADSVTLYIEAYNEVAGEWYVAVTKEMTKNGNEFTYTHEFANAGSKRVYAKTANGTSSDTIEITANALKETLEAPVGGTMTATVGEEVTISWGAVANATGYTAHLYEMVDGQLESIGDVTDLIEGTSLKYTFAEAGEYRVGVIATAEGYNPSEQSAVIVTIEAAISVPDTQSPVIDPITSTVASPITAGTEVTFSATAADDVDLAKIELFIDGELKKTETVSGLSGTISYTTSALAIGEHTVMVVATDASGLTNDVSLTVTVQKADFSTCAHLNTTVIPDPQYVSINAEQHKLVYTYWTHCLDCNTGLSNVQDEDLPEKHAWKDGACEKCKHVCSHNFELYFNEKNENVEVPGSGEWKRYDENSHYCATVRYVTICSICATKGESETKMAGWTAPHTFVTQASATEYDGNRYRTVESQQCSLKACGYWRTVYDSWHEYEYTNGQSSSNSGYSNESEEEKKNSWDYDRYDYTNDNNVGLFQLKENSTIDYVYGDDDKLQLIWDSIASSIVNYDQLMYGRALDEIEEAVLGENLTSEEYVGTAQYKTVLATTTSSIYAADPRYKNELIEKLSSYLNIASGSGDPAEAGVKLLSQKEINQIMEMCEELENGLRGSLKLDADFEVANKETLEALDWIQSYMGELSKTGGKIVENNNVVKTLGTLGDIADVTSLILNIVTTAQIYTADMSDNIVALKCYKNAIINSEQYEIDSDAELIRAIDTLIEEYSDMKLTALDYFSTYGLGTVAGMASMALPPVAVYNGIIQASGGLMSVGGIYDDSEARMFTTYSEGSVIQMLLGGMIDTELQLIVGKGDEITQEEFDEYKTIALYCYQARLDQIEKLISSGAVSGADKERLEEMWLDLYSGLLYIKSETLGVIN